MHCGAAVTHKYGSAFPWLEPFDDSPAELYLKDRHNTYLWLNKQATRVTGVRRDDVIGKRVGRWPLWPAHRCANRMSRRIASSATR